MPQQFEGRGEVETVARCKERGLQLHLPLK